MELELSVSAWETFSISASPFNTRASTTKLDGKSVTNKERLLKLNIDGSVRSLGGREIVGSNRGRSTWRNWHGAMSDDEFFAIKRRYNIAKRWTSSSSLRVGCWGGSRGSSSRQIRWRRVVGRRCEADVSVVLLMDETASVRVRLVVNHPADAEGIDIAERSHVVAVWFPFLLVILPLQVVLEAVRRAISAVIRRQIGRIATRDGRSVAGPRDERTSHRGVVRCLKDRSRSSRGSTIERSLRSRISLLTLQAGRGVTRSARVVIVAGNRRHTQSRSDGRRDVIAGSDVVAGQRHDVIETWSSVKEWLTFHTHFYNIIIIASRESCFYHRWFYHAVSVIFFFYRNALSFVQCTVS